MPYAYGANINHVFDVDHLDVYVTFRHPMQRSEIPQADPPVYDWYPPIAKWLLEADEVDVDILSSEWLDEHTLLLTSDAVASEPTGVTLEYAGPDEKLCTTWGKQWEPWGPKPSYAGYPTAPALHNSTHENGGADEINIAGLSGLATDTQHSFVDRGDPADFDWTQATLTTNGNWQDLDLSAIVPVGTKSVLLRVGAMDDALDRAIWIRKKGNVNNKNSAALWLQVANKYITFDVIVALDENRKCQYLATNAVWSYISFLVAGWWL